MPESKIKPRTKTRRKKTIEYSPRAHDHTLEQDVLMQTERREEFG